MKNKKLIEILSKLPMDAEIMVANYDNRDYFEHMDIVVSFTEDEIVFADDGYKDNISLRGCDIPLKSIILNWH
jgi:hypothetical protein